MVGVRRETRPFAGWDVVALQQSQLYDVLMWLPMLIWSLFLGLVTLLGLQHYMRQSDPGLPDMVYLLNIAMRASLIAYFIMIAASGVVRTQPARKARGVEPRISALLGTFLLTAVAVFPVVIYR